MNEAPEPDRPIVRLRPSTVSVDPAMTAAIEVRVTNAGAVVDEFAIDLLGAPAAWGSVEPSTVSLFPGQEANVSVRIVPPRGPAGPAGLHDLGIRVRSTRDATASTVEEARVEVRPAAEVSMRLVPSTRNGSGGATYRLDLENLGNTPVELDVVGRDPDELLTVKVARPAVTLESGGRASTNVRVTAVEPFFRGPTVQRSFIVETSAGGPPLASASGRLNQGALLGGLFVPVLVALIGLGAIAFLLNAGLISLPGTAAETVPPQATAAPPAATDSTGNGSPPASVAPAGGGDVVVGPTDRVLGPGQATDLDDPNGQVVVPPDGSDAGGLDILAGPVAPLSLEPIGGALVGLGGREALGREGCSATTVNKYAVAPDALDVGVHLCVRTSDRRITELEVMSSGSQLVLRFTTWDVPAG